MTDEEAFTKWLNSKYPSLVQDTTFPTSELNFLQRLRILLEKEKQLEAELARLRKEKP